MNTASLTAICLALAGQAIVASIARAEDRGDTFDSFSGRVHGAQTENVRSAWGRIPPSTKSCVQQHGVSVSAMVEAGVLPGDPRLKSKFVECRAQQSSPLPNAEARLQSEPLEPSAQTGQLKLVVDGVELGEVLDAQARQFKQYHCTASKTFPEHTWCQRTATGHGNDGPFTATNMILQSADGSVAYVSRAIKPAHFATGDIDTEIARLSRRYGSPHILKSRAEQIPSGVIVYWGSLKLFPLDADAVNLIASGQPSGKGFLFDFLGNLSLSAQNGLEIFRASEGRGYVWSASFDDSGTGVLRLTAIDEASVGAPVGTGAVNPSAGDLLPSTPEPTSPPASLVRSLPDASEVVRAPTAEAKVSQKNPGSGFGTFARLTELPAACVAVKNLGADSTWPKGWAQETRDPFSGRYSKSEVCNTVLECLPVLSGRLKPIVEYLRTRPLLYAALKDAATPSQSMSVDSAIETIGSRVDLSISDCQVYVVTLDRLMARTGADPGHIGIPAPIEYLQDASSNLITRLRKDHEANNTSYSDWLPYAKHYGRAAQLAVLKQRYEDAFGGPDIEALLAATQNINQAMISANEFRETLMQQGSKLTELGERLNDLARRAAQEPLSKIVKPNTATQIESLKAEIARFGMMPAPERGDVSVQLGQFETSANDFQSDLQVAQERLDVMLQQGGKLAELSNRLTELAQQAVQEPLSKLVKPNTSTGIEKLKGAIDSLARAPIPERGDVATQITQYETDVSEFENDVKEAQEEAAAAVKEAQDKAAADAASKEESERRTKGVAYAKASGTTWALKKIKNEMTDKSEAVAISLQNPTPGVKAEITASCLAEGIVKFSAVVTDDNGRPNVTIPFVNQTSISVNVRKNEYRPVMWNIPSDQILEGFRNKLAIGLIILRPTTDQLKIQQKIDQMENDTSINEVQRQLALQFAQIAVGGATAIDLKRAWRMLVQLDSSSGPMLLKLPIYADAIQTVISECKEQ